MQRPNRLTVRFNFHPIPVADIFSASSDWYEVFTYYNNSIVRFLPITNWIQ